MRPHRLDYAAHQAPPSLGFSRQEHWSGLPLPCPMHESDKWKWSRSVVSNSVRPHRRQPTRLPRPWDSPGKNTGVGCHFPLQCMKVTSESEVAQAWTAAYQAPPSMGFSRGEFHWRTSACFLIPFLTPGSHLLSGQDSVLGNQIRLSAHPFCTSKSQLLAYY